MHLYSCMKHAANIPVEENTMGERKGGYNGWKNYATWNVALWIGNDEGLYRMALKYAKQGYKAFAEMLREDAGLTETLDGVAYNDSGLDIRALDRMMKELAMSTHKECN